MKKKYSVIVSGENFVLNIDGQQKTYGFVTTRNVKAASVEEAEKAAINLVEHDADLMTLMVENQSDLNPPTLFVDEMYELSWWQKLGGKGFTFFEQGSN